MRMLIASLILTTVASWILWRLAPELLRGTRRLLLATGVLLVHGAWFWLRILKGATDEGLLELWVRGLAGTWIVAALLCAALGGPLLLGRWLASRRSGAGGAEVDPGRRRVLASVLPVTALATSAGGTASGLEPFELKEEEVRLPGLPRALDGFRIGQITDVHVGDFIDPSYLERAVVALDQAGVDLQVMTGDLIDDLSQLDATFDALERCQARHGMLAILGNHEIWRGRDEVIAAYERRAAHGIVKLLVDESVVLDHHGAPLRVVGVDYPMIPGGSHRLPKGRRTELMKNSAKKAFSGAREDETILCLTHHPDFFPFAAEHGAKITLAGHTHGGQVGIFGVSAFFFAYEHMLGRYRKQDAHLYVSGGTGHWLPFRVGIPTEITVITLRSA